MIPFPLLFSFSSAVGHACRGEDSKGVVEYCLNRGFSRITRISRILGTLETCQVTVSCDGVFVIFSFFVLYFIELGG